ncbi:phosphate ABC transporter permease subunit PstC [Deinococcus radiophilus]|uniref:Phosphate transport system permease protein n=1 Tax=Deinococcus radiophilus TaxID=32062 RepID=A0A431VRS6_9DEIO|nr:phosphate ABC transporter permease subunit PstC [Deinococcus radiophilus]RTR25917.1 phosphate ABC transporter permease subunit PstC [Deinococcus radiophilus]UFA49709.1 phosphate ABC transporter permease subunit PstC [Deinococcus radiophilus]
MSQAAKPPQPGRGMSHRSDSVFRNIIIGLSLIIALIFILSLYQLGRVSWPSLSTFGLDFYLNRTWDPVNNVYGALSMIIGTLVTSLIALAISVPLAIASALYVSEYAPNWLKGPVSYLIELLAAVPSVVYGLWALTVIAPVLAAWQLTYYMEPSKLEQVTACQELWKQGTTSFQCFFTPAAADGRGLALATLILTVMILPYTASVARDVIGLVPRDQREAMYALGATKWEVLQKAVLPYARAGIMGGILLALGRALGETLAVAMVIGDSQAPLTSIWQNFSTMASVIANQFGDAQQELHRSSVLALGLTLFFVSVLVNVLARMVIKKLTPEGIK